jgi:hypothetical protein
MRHSSLQLLISGALLLQWQPAEAAPQESQNSAAPADTLDRGQKESQVCMSCHRFNGQGADIAGDLGSLREQTRDALRLGLGTTKGDQVLMARLPAGGAVPVVRRAWTGQLYDLSSSPPQPHKVSDFESLAPYPPPGWVHPTEAKSIDDAQLDDVLLYLKVNNTFGEELRTAQQKEADWEKLDRSIFADIAKMSSCDGRISKRIGQVKDGEIAAYQAWKQYYDKWVSEDVERLNKRRRDPAPAQTDIDRENDNLKDLQTQIVKVKADVEAMRLRHGDTAPGERLLAGLNASVGDSQTRLAHLASVKQTILDFNTSIDEQIAADRQSIDKLEGFHKTASEIYDDRVAEFEARCNKEIKR